MSTSEDFDEPINLAGIEFYEIEKIVVAEFHEDPDGGGPPTQVHLLLTMSGWPHPFIMRFKSRPTLDELIVNLIRHGKEVWP